MVPTLFLLVCLSTCGALPPYDNNPENDFGSGLDVKSLGDLRQLEDGLLSGFELARRIMERQGNYKPETLDGIQTVVDSAKIYTAGVIDKLDTFVKSVNKTDKDKVGSNVDPALDLVTYFAEATFDLMKNVTNPGGQLSVETVRNVAKIIRDSVSPDSPTPTEDQESKSSSNYLI